VVSSDPACLHRYFRLPKAQITYVKFVVEAYGGLAQVFSVRGRGEMEWIIPREMEDQAQSLASALAEEIGMVVIPRPEDWPDFQSN